MDIQLKQAGRQAGCSHNSIIKESLQYNESNNEMPVIITLFFNSGWGNTFSETLNLLINIHEYTHNLDKLTGFYSGLTR